MTFEQIEEYKPPPNPTKFSDSRAEAYVERHGYSSWELDALNPKVLEELVEEAIIKHIDAERFDTMTARETHYRNMIHKLKDLDELKNSY